jgi:hypothetical protein
MFTSVLALTYVGPNLNSSERKKNESNRSNGNWPALEAISSVPWTGYPPCDLGSYGFEFQSLMIFKAQNDIPIVPMDLIATAGQNEDELIVVHESITHELSFIPCTSRPGQDCEVSFNDA